MSKLHILPPYGCSIVESITASERLFPIYISCPYNCRDLWCISRCPEVTREDLSSQFASFPTFLSEVPVFTAAFLPHAIVIYCLHFPSGRASTFASIEDMI